MIHQQYYLFLLSYATLCGNYLNKQNLNITISVPKNGYRHMLIFFQLKLQKIL